MRNTRRQYLSLTPMIDVVFILLLFFLLSTQLQPHQILPLQIAAAGQTQETKPITLLEIGETISLNGAEISATEWQEFIKNSPKQPIAIRPADGIMINQLIQYIDSARESGIKEIILVKRGSNP